MTRAITLSFTEDTIRMMNRLLPRGRKSAFIEQAVMDKLALLDRQKRVSKLLASVKQFKPARAGTAVRLLRRDRARNN